VAFAGSQGNFELNAMRPVINNNFLHAATILADGCEKFRRFSVEGTELNRERIAGYVGNSLMLVTALSLWSVTRMPRISLRKQRLKALRSGKRRSLLAGFRPTNTIGSSSPRR
jgi:aspartate ammonia-lyase